MLRNIFRVLVIFLTLIGITLMLSITLVDRTPYKELGLYPIINERLDSLESALLSPDSDASNHQLNIGWSKINITPEKNVPLAGYGNRDPKMMDGIHDSSFVRTVVFKKGDQKVAIVTADLLIIHPEITRKVWQLLSNEWSRDELFLTATHTHSGQGGWAPGLVGKLFAGPFEYEVVERIAQKIVASIKSAESMTDPGIVSYAEFSVDNLVRNRLVNDQGIIDPWFKVLKMQTQLGVGFFSFFSAHATCFGHDSHQLSSDYPGQLVSLLEQDSTTTFAAFGAGAMGSMGYDLQAKSGEQKARIMASQLAQQIQFFGMVSGGYLETESLNAYQIEVPMRDPYFKITKNIALRPYLFESLFGSYQSHIRVAQIGSILLIGLPCDFSGELSPALYDYAREKNLNLILSSFNGEYIGYVVKDEWYDLDLYESRVMSWYGPDTGSYFSEIIKRIIDATAGY